MEFPSVPPPLMSLSPAESASMASDNGNTQNPAKRKRASFSSSNADQMHPQFERAASTSAPLQSPMASNGNGLAGQNGNGLSNHIPKRGARACTNCRKGKNRCEGESPCRRCQLSGAQCVFEKPEKKSPVVANTTNAVERVSRLEGQYLIMQSQMIGMQSSLDRILAAIQSSPTTASPQSQTASQMTPQSQPQSQPGQSTYAPSISSGQSPQEMGFQSTAMQQLRPMAAVTSPTSNYFPGPSVEERPRRQRFPPLPGFAPPPHKFATYGIVPSTAPSSEDESEDTLPRSSLNAPIEALQGLANAAAEAAAAPLTSSPRVKKRKRVEPTPRNAFPNVLDKGLVSESEARELYHIFFSGCHLFIPLFDPAYDTFESLRVRTPFCFDAILAVASKIRAGTGPPTPTFHRCLEEAQGIARSTLFGPVVRKEAVQAMLLLSAWSTSGWLPSGHAMRMALDLGLNRALEKLADGPSSGGKKRTDDEERDLVVSARIWLCLYWFDHQMSLGTGRPIILRDEGSVRHCRLLLSHPMASPTDVRLVALVELIAQKTQIYETLAPLNGQVTHATLAFVRRANIALEKWWAECDELHRPIMDEDALMRKILSGELLFARVWLVCVALRGVSWEKMPFEQRELAFQAKEAASDCLATFLHSPEYRAALRYAVHDSLVTAAFSGLFLLKIAHLFPSEVDLSAIMMQVEQLAQLLSEVAAERYALTLRLMLANLRRKIGISSVQPTPPTNMAADGATLMPGYTADPSAPMQQHHNYNLGIPSAPASLEELGFTWPDGIFSPTNIPIWLQEANLSDLGLPSNAYDGIFIPMNTGMSGDIGVMPEAW